MPKIKLTKVEAAPYKCSATYEWEDNTIERDASCLAGGYKYWYCEPLFKGYYFKTLKGVKEAIRRHLNGEKKSEYIEECMEI